MTPYEALAAVLAHVQSAMEQCQRDPLTVTLVAAGEVPIDDCCGLLAVLPENVTYATLPFPTPIPSLYGCTVPLVQLDVLVVLARCVPTMTSSGRAPNRAASEAAYRNVIDDASVIWNALVDVDTVGDDGWGWEIATPTQAIQAPQGGCVLVETRISYGIPYEQWCAECPDPPSPVDDDSEP